VRLSGEENLQRDADLAIADECRLNVLWLHAQLPARRALEIEVPGLGLSAALGALYQQSERVFDDGFIGGRPGCCLGFPDRSFDLVTLYGRAPAAGAAAEMRRVLRDEGLALIGTGNGSWPGRFRRGAPTAAWATATQLVDALLQAGFREVHPYWATPSLETPRALIPARREAVRSYEAMRAHELGGDAFRSLASRAGLSRLLYPVLLVVAKA
jgi:SAM-dependent methyltransferase